MASAALDDLLDVGEFHVDKDDLRQVKNHTKDYIAGLKEIYEEEKLRAHVMEAFLAFVRYYYKKSLKPNPCDCADCRKWKEKLQESDNRNIKD